MPRAEVNGIQMNYEVAGDGPPLVLIHAWPTDHAVWQLQVPVFSQYYRTIAIDLRGCGQSDKPAGPNTPEVMSADVIVPPRRSWALSARRLPVSHSGESLLLN